jgi:N-methylhydantoinase B/oxoprolinase/acetone carboxylase alpha subunit
VTYGDFRAMLGSLDLAERRIHTLIDEHGLEIFQRAGEELIDVAERRMRAELEQIPDGTYTFEDEIEDDGIGTASYPMKLALTIDGSNVIADFTGTAAQATGPVNAIYAVTASAIYNAFLHITDPTIPRNEGCYRPFTVIVPRGSLLNCEFPAPVAGGNTETSPRITDMAFGALAEAIPDRIVASCGGTSSPFLFGGHDPRSGEPYAHFHFEGVGWGGRPWGDGNDMIVTINGNCRNTPVEVFESRYPAFRIDEYRLLADSGGPGRHRGGLGGERIFTVTTPQVTVSALLNRVHTEPWGVLGGRAGAPGKLEVQRGGTGPWRTFVEEFGTASPSKFSGIMLHEGDRVRITMPGGGGYGDPQTRDRDLVRRDVAEGFVTAPVAREVYGMSDHDLEERDDG